MTIFCTWLVPPIARSNDPTISPPYYRQALMTIFCTWLVPS
jgi:hypothetical protein